MIDHDSIRATLSFERSEPPDFYGLAGPILWFLRRSAIPVTGVDLGLLKDAIAVQTDLARIELVSEGNRVAIRVTPHSGRQCERARQICYRLTRRLLESHPKASAYWHTTREHLDATAFARRPAQTATLHAQAV